MNRIGFASVVVGLLAILNVNPTRADESVKIVFIAGKRSHNYGTHEHYAGSVLLAKALQQAIPNVDVSVLRNGWPADSSTLQDAQTVVIYSDGGPGHPVIKHLDQMQALADQGVGIVCLHYAVEVPRGRAGRAMVDWIGGYFETHWSVNPHWTANFESLPVHPITRGVKPFEVHDEWYYHMRFREGMKGVAPILTAIPPESTLSRRDGPHSGNPHVRKKVGQPQHVAWAVQREDGGRGFGFTGGHFHWNWGDPNMRKLVLNAIAWTAKIDIPENGIESTEVTLKQLEANQDEPPPRNYDREDIRRRFGIRDKSSDPNE